MSPEHSLMSQRGISKKAHISCITVVIKYKLIRRFSNNLFVSLIRCFWREEKGCLYLRP